MMLPIIVLFMVLLTLLTLWAMGVTNQIIEDVSRQNETKKENKYGKEVN